MRGKNKKPTKQVAKYPKQEGIGEKMGWYPYANGVRQSPIDIVINQTVNGNRSALSWGGGFFEEPTKQEVLCDSHTVVIKTTCRQTPTISGGPLPQAYYLHSIHFHWAEFNFCGSEHTLNGQSYPLEMHCVCTKGNMSLDNALRHKDGLVVIGYIIDLLPGFLTTKLGKQRNAFAILARNMDRLRAVNAPVQMNERFSLDNLMVPFDYNYFTYEGSLTTPNFDEVVRWIIPVITPRIAHQQMKAFRALHGRHLMHEKMNYRGVQPLCGRKVEYVRGGRLAHMKQIAEGVAISRQPYASTLMLQNNLQRIK